MKIIFFFKYSICYSFVIHLIEIDIFIKIAIFFSVFYKKKTDIAIIL